jgi:hypothetical protein
LRKIIQAIPDAPPADIDSALGSLRFEQKVKLEGHGAGALWSLVRGS